MAIELSGQSYEDLVQMPVKRLEEYIEWKIKFDADVAKLKEEYLKKSANKR